jgi:hypothetical protein
LLAEEVPLIIEDMLRVLTVRPAPSPSAACGVWCGRVLTLSFGCTNGHHQQWMDDLKGDTEEQNKEREVQETLEQERARLRKKVALSLDSMLKHGRKEKEEAEEKPPGKLAAPGRHLGMHSRITIIT